MRSANTWRSLASAVVVKGETVDEIGRIARGAVHGGHARRVLSGFCFQEGLVQQGLNIERQQGVQDLLSVWLVLVVPA